MPSEVMTKVVSLLYIKFKTGSLPIAIMSIDNCSNNGKKPYDSVRTIVDKWIENRFIEKEFISYINYRSKVTFPWSMIDKITLRPSKSVEVSVLYSH